MHWKTYDWKNKKAGQKGEILKKINYKCGLCKGSGFMHSNNNIRCPACFGDGTVKVLPPAVICVYCNGEGGSILSRDLTCIVCKGKGVISVSSVSSKDIEPCPVCKGKGRDKDGSLPCRLCQGKGIVAKNEFLTSNL